MAFVDHLFAVIPLLGLLIFVHELGHFLVAKACGVRVLKFSLGFGSPVGFGRYRMRWIRGGTEYVVAWFPLGGFVRMLGGYLPGDEDATDEAPDATPDEYLDSKPVWQKLAISFAGPAMNLFLPVICFLLIFWIGTPRASSVVGIVERGSPAEEAGLRVDDQIVFVDGQPVSWWDEVEIAVRTQLGGSVTLGILRDGSEESIVVSSRPRRGMDRFGDIELMGWIGLGHRRLPALIGIPLAASPAMEAGLRSADRVVSVNGVEIESWVDLQRAYEESGLDWVGFEIEREGERVELTVPVLGSLSELGVSAAAILIQDVSPDLPAERAGLRPGDLIVQVDGEPAGSFDSFRQKVLASGGAAMDVTFARDGMLETVRLAPEESKVPGPMEGMEETVYLIGITNQLATLTGELRMDRERNPMVAVPRAFSNTFDMIGIFMTGLGKLFSGQVGTEQLAGPIGIAEVARKALDRGWHFYIHTLMFISINLGILNLLPIPVLDGGQIVLYTIEGVKRAPVSLRTREIVQSVGFTVLVMLMGLAFWNDLSRNWTRFVEWLGGAG